MLCLHVCVTEARTIVTWLTEQAKSLLNVNSAYLSVVCLHAVGCLSKDYSCLAHGANRGLLYVHMSVVMLVQISHMYSHAFCKCD